MSPKYLSRSIFLVIIFSAVCISNTKAVDVTGKYGFFSHITSLNDTLRVDSARDLYRKNCRKMQPAKAMAALDKLTLLALDINDKALECAVFDMRADYYSVNQLFNHQSTRYHLQAISFARKHHMVVEEGIYLHRMGVYYAVYHKYTEAFNCILQALDIFKKVGFSNVPYMDRYLFQMADFYYNINDLSSSAYYAKLSLRYKGHNTRLTINTVNTLGLISRQQKKYNEAMRYFNEAMAIAVKANDKAWVGILKGNIGSIYFIKEQYDKALPFIQTDYQTSVKYGEHCNAAIALSRLAAINLYKGNYAEVEQQLGKVEECAARTRKRVTLMVDLYRLRSELYERTGRLSQAIAAIKQYNLMRDSLQAEESRDAVEQVRIKWEQDKYNRNLAIIKHKAETDKLKRNAFIGLILLAGVIAVLMYNIKLSKAKTKTAELCADKKRVDQELETATRDLFRYTKSLQEQNQTIESFKNEIQRLSSRADEEKTVHINNLLQTHIITDSNWTEFKRLFVRVYPGFFEHLRSAYPTLSETDLRILALIKLDISNREMADMLGITTDGVKKSKQRLRKKIGLYADDPIESIVHQV